MKKAFEIATLPLKWIMAMIAAILRVFGINAGSGGGGPMVPKAPEIEKGDARNETADPGRGFEYSPEQNAAMTAAIVAFAGAPKEMRKAVDLARLPAVEKAFLNACDEKTLASLAKMEPDKALDFVLMQTAKAKSAMTKHPPRDERIRIGREAPAIAEELLTEEREKRQDKLPRQRKAAPTYRLAMGM